jgi:hypothetical protein
MITIEFITALFYEVDEQLRPIPKHPEAHLWPSEVVTLGLLHALKGVGNRMLVETVLSRRTLVCHLKKVMHRGWAYVQARLAFTMAAFNVLVQWHGLRPNASGFVPLSIAEFSL